MPLSRPAPRAHFHARTLTCNGFLREDGLWEVEGRIVDHRTYAFDNEWRGRVEPETPLHEMWIRLTLDDAMTITAVEAATDHSPFAICPDVLPNFQRLVGTRIGPGFARSVREAVGGKRGCTHIVDMLSQVATVALQTKVTAHARWMRSRQLGESEAASPKPSRSPWADGQGGGARPVIDTCYAWASDGDVVRRLLPDHFTGRS
jgi:Protein of unknown function (DUF2889)